MALVHSTFHLSNFQVRLSILSLQPFTIHTSDSEPSSVARTSDSSDMTGTMNRASSFVTTQLSKGQRAADAVFPPKRRQDTMSTLKAFAEANPKLAAFIACNVALTGPPVLVFTGFILSVFLFTLFTGLMIAGFVALVLTVMLGGIALLILVPTVFFTTIGACFLSIFGLSFQYAFKWHNGPSTTPTGQGIGDRVKNFTERTDRLLPSKSQSETNNLQARQEQEARILNRDTKLPPNFSNQSPLSGLEGEVKSQADETPIQADTQSKENETSIQQDIQDLKDLNIQTEDLTIPITSITIGGEGKKEDRVDSATGSVNGAATSA
ncbi:hypothetical protein EJ08DRAFT_581729 [Tothia fuscella]|uniref:Uncharacterized protein n=1 Tax=Tothia fuscella TaxID=1048955 RepID=A0A9P4U3C7_9PEZI|nr:hypothetical protein EJ08DRAFT_581729 [Tothia fuscella]